MWSSLNKPHKHTKADKIITINTVREFVLLGKQKEGKVLICHLQHKHMALSKKVARKRRVILPSTSWLLKNTPSTFTSPNTEWVSRSKPFGHLRGKKRGGGPNLEICLKEIETPVVNINKSNKAAWAKEIRNIPYCIHVHLSRKFKMKSQKTSSILW